MLLRWCWMLVLLFVVGGVAGVADGVAGCWCSYGGVVGGAGCKLALMFVVGGVAGVVMAHAASLHTHGGAVGCVVDGWRYYGSVVGGAGCSCVGAGCWRSYGSVVMA